MSHCEGGNFGSLFIDHDGLTTLSEGDNKQHCESCTPVQCYKILKMGIDIRHIMFK